MSVPQAYSYGQPVDTSVQNSWHANISDELDPRHITRGQMDKLADCIEAFVDFMDSCAVVQPGAPPHTQDGLDEGLKRARKLIKKLRKYDVSGVFKDEEEWNPLM